MGFYVGKLMGEGYITANPIGRDYLETREKVPKKSSNEDIAGRIIYAVLPYLHANISDRDFDRLQDVLCGIAKDFRRELRTENKRLLRESKELNK